MSGFVYERIKFNLRTLGRYRPEYIIFFTELQKTAHPLN